MVSIIEVEIFGFLSFSNWSDFDQKMVKNWSFWASMCSKLGFITLCLKVYFDTIEHKS